MSTRVPAASASTCTLSSPARVSPARLSIALVSLACVLLAYASAASAQQRVLIAGPPRDPIVTHLEDELRALGLEADVVDVDVGALAWSELRALARERNAAAVLGASRVGAELVVVVTDRLTGKVTFRALRLEGATDEESARIVAVRAVELLRLSLQELDGPGPPAEAEVVPAPPSLRAIAAEPSRRAWLSIGAGALLSMGGLGPVVVLPVAFAYRPTPRWRIALSASVPLTAARVAAPAGTADVRAWDAHLELRWRPLGDVTLSPDLGLALGAQLLALSGAAASGYASREDVVVAASGAFVAGCELRLGGALALRLDASVGVAVPRLGVVLGEARVATWGRPVASAALSLAVGL